MMVTMIATTPVRKRLHPANAGPAFLVRGRRRVGHGATKPALMVRSTLSETPGSARLIPKSLRFALVVRRNRN